MIPPAEAEATSYRSGHSDRRLPGTWTRRSPWTHGASVPRARRVTADHLSVREETQGEALLLGQLLSLLRGWARLLNWRRGRGRLFDRRRRGVKLLDRWRGRG